MMLSLDRADIGAVKVFLCLARRDSRATIVICAWHVFRKSRLTHRAVTAAGYMNGISSAFAGADGG